MDKYDPHNYDDFHAMDYGGFGEMRGSEYRSMGGSGPRGGGLPPPRGLSGRGRMDGRRGRGVGGGGGMSFSKIFVLYAYIRSDSGPA